MRLLMYTYIYVHTRIYIISVTYRKRLGVVDSVTPLSAIYTTVIIIVVIIKVYERVDSDIEKAIVRLRFMCGYNRYITIAQPVSNLS